MKSNLVKFLALAGSSSTYQRFSSLHGVNEIHVVSPWLHQLCFSVTIIIRLNAFPQIITIIEKNK